MNVNKYADYFHDGGIINIRQSGDRIEISMESSQMHPEWNEDNISLSSYQTIKGKLHLDNIKSIVVDHNLTKQLIMIHDSADVLNFEVYNNKKNGFISNLV